MLLTHRPSTHQAKLSHREHRRTVQTQKMDAIVEALQSISGQNKGTELKIEQQDRKADVQVQEISERLENLGARVSNQQLKWSLSTNK